MDVPRNTRNSAKQNNKEKAYSYNADKDRGNETLIMRMEMV